MKCPNCQTELNQCPTCGEKNHCAACKACFGYRGVFELPVTTAGHKP